MTVTRNPSRLSEVAYSEITSNFSQVAVQNTDYTVLTITVLASSRPVMVEGYLATVTNSAASANLTGKLYDGATQLQSSSKLAPATAGGGAGSMHCMARLAASAVDRTITFTLRTATAGTPTITAVCAATAPGFLTATER